MRVALAQMTVREGDVAGNLEKARRLARKAMGAGADIVAFPELFLTGYDWRAIKRTTPSSTRQTAHLVRSLAAGIAVVGGSFAESRGGELRNTTIVVNKEGRRLATYRKVHLFGLLGEDRAFAAGNRTSSFTLDGWKAGVATCYDLRFPELFRRLTYAHAAEVIFIQSAWPMPRQSAWDLLLRARAIENQCYVCGTNRVGQAGTLDYFGSSQIVTPLGDILANKGRGEGLLVADIDMAEVDRVRKLIPALPDRRPSVYGRY